MTLNSLRKLCTLFVLFLIIPSEVLTNHESKPKQENLDQEIAILDEEEENLLNEESYLAHPINSFSCIEHVKMMEVNYTCWDSKSLSAGNIGRVVPEDIEGIKTQAFYVVSKNGEKHFMKVLDMHYNLELKIVPIFAYDNYSFWLVEYKIVNGRFLGLYSYRKHYNTLRYNILENKLSLFDKVYILKKMVLMMSDFYAYTPPKNDLIMFNLWPSNIIMTQEGFNHIRLINYLVNHESFDIFGNIPELQENDHTQVAFNTKATSIFMFGKLIFFFLFGRYSKEEFISNEPEVKEIEESTQTDRETRIKKFLIQISKNMLEKDPVERPSIEMVSSQMEKAVEVMTDPFMAIKEGYMTYMSKVREELQDEYDDMIDKIRLENRKKSFNKLKSKKSITVKAREYAEAKKEIDALNQKFFDYEGLAHNCKLKATHSLINPLDNYGTTPALISTIEDNEVVVEDMLEKKENSTRGASNNTNPDRDPREFRYEFILINAIMLILISMCVAFFCLKNWKVKMYDRDFFSAKLIIF